MKKSYLAMMGAIGIGLTVPAGAQQPGQPAATTNLSPAPMATPTPTPTPGQKKRKHRGHHRHRRMQGRGGDDAARQERREQRRQQRDGTAQNQRRDLRTKRDAKQHRGDSEMSPQPGATPSPSPR